MKINGEIVNAPFRREIVFPRVQGDIVFKATSVSTSKDFEKLCPPVKPKVEKDLNGKVIKIHDDSQEYLDKVTERFRKATDYQIIRSLENVTWDTVDIDDSDSWKNWREEVLSIGLSDMEVNTLINKVIETLQPSVELIEEAKKRFLAEQAQKEEAPSQPSQDSEQPSI